MLGGSRGEDLVGRGTSVATTTTIVAHVARLRNEVSGTDPTAPEWAIRSQRECRSRGTRRDASRISFRNRATWATMVVVVATLVPLPTRSSPLDPPSIPLPEHPRPDFERAQWQNLNGPWQFEFDGQDVGESQRWYRTGPPTARPIVVPFPWGSPLSGVPDSAPIGWYARTIDVPAAWSGRRGFLVIGAADWRTTAWLAGQALGLHDGGYIPVEVGLPQQPKPGQPPPLVVPVG